MWNKIKTNIKKIIDESILKTQNIMGEKQFRSDVIFSLSALVLYLFSFEIILIYIFDITDGVNFVFVSRSWKFVAIISIGITIANFILAKFDWRETLIFSKTQEKIVKKDFLLLLLPLTFIVQYIINNIEILSFLGVLSILVFFSLFSAIYVFGIPFLSKIFGSTRIIIAVGLAFVTTIFRMSLLSHERFWFDIGSLKPQWMFFVYVFFVIWLLYRLNDKKFLSYLVIIFFISNSFLQINNRFFNNKVPGLPIQENKLVSIVKGKEQVLTPNIYLLVYDSYVINETMLKYGIDNSSQEEYLEDLGFKIYPKTYSVADLSAGTMSRVFNVSTEFYGSTRQGASGDGIVQNILKSYGYQTYGIFFSDYFFRENVPTYDFYFPDISNSSSLLIEAIMEGVFRFDIGFEKMPYENYVKRKQSLFADVPDEKLFLYTHTWIPGHSSLTGVCRPNEFEIYKNRLDQANIEMRQDLAIITQNDPEAIIVVAGDHGPYRTNNCSRFEDDHDVSTITRLDIQDRFGAFLAIRWPSGDFEKFDDITVIQDIFPSIFAYLFDDDKFLEAKIDPSTIRYYTYETPIIDVRDGIIYGGINDGEPLFIADD